MDELLGPDRRHPDVLDVLASRPAGGDLVEGKTGPAENGSEQVVEVVGDAAGEESQALQLLRLQELALQRAPFLGAGTTVGDVGDPAQDQLAPAPEGERRQLDLGRELPPADVLVHPLEHRGLALEHAGR